MAKDKVQIERARDGFLNMQRDICEALEKIDGGKSFVTDEWTRVDRSGGHGGGGITRVISDGKVFEKGGVNFSEVHGNLPADLARALGSEAVDTPFFAIGTSLVIHPHNPHVPTIHANCRYLEVGEKKWWGGGIDLTPFVLYEDDCVHFHTGLKKICDRHGADFYSRYKKWCDEYFYIAHRKETRGIGGIFFDYLGKSDPDQLSLFGDFTLDIAKGFNDLYLPIVERRKDTPSTEEQKRFQLIRRGRYVEFNLVYDRGTLFGLKTDGRIESILMSLPLMARWEYCFEQKAGSDEEKLLEIFKSPREWV